MRATIAFLNDSVSPKIWAAGPLEAVLLNQAADSRSGASVRRGSSLCDQPGQASALPSAVRRALLERSFDRLSAGAHERRALLTGCFNRMQALRAAAA
jgi:hypothetical protein